MLVDLFVIRSDGVLFLGEVGTFKNDLAEFFKANCYNISSFLILAAAIISSLRIVCAALNSLLLILLTLLLLLL